MGSRRHGKHGAEQPPSHVDRQVIGDVREVRAHRARLAKEHVAKHGDRGVDDNVLAGKLVEERSDFLAVQVELVGVLAQFAEAQLRAGVDRAQEVQERSEEHTSELQSLMRISYAVFCLKKKIKNNTYI